MTEMTDSELKIWFRALSPSQKVLCRICTKSIRAIQCENGQLKWVSIQL